MKKINKITVLSFLAISVVNWNCSKKNESEEAENPTLGGKHAFSIAWVELDDPLLAYHEAYGQAAQQVKAWLRKNDFPAEAVAMTVKSR